MSCSIFSVWRLLVAGWAAWPAGRPAPSKLLPTSGLGVNGQQLPTMLQPPGSVGGTDAAAQLQASSPESRTVWVGGLPDQYATEEAVSSALCAMGEITRTVVRSKPGGKSWALVEFATRGAAEGVLSPGELAMHAPIAARWRLCAVHREKLRSLEAVLSLEKLVSGSSRSGELHQQRARDASREVMIAAMDCLGAKRILQSLERVGGVTPTWVQLVLQQADPSSSPLETSLGTTSEHNENSGRQISTAAGSEQHQSGLAHLSDFVSRHIATDLEAEALALHCKAIIALYGVIFFWLGAWTILDIDVRREMDSAPPVDEEGTIARSYWFDCLYLGGGVCVLLLTDTLFSNAGVTGPSTCPFRFAHGVHNLHKKHPAIAALVAWLRIALALLGSVCVWVGLYNFSSAAGNLWLMRDFHDRQVHWAGSSSGLPTPQTLPVATVSLVSLILGITGVSIAGSLFSVSGVVGHNVDDPHKPSSTSLNFTKLVAVATVKGHRHRHYHRNGLFCSWGVCADIPCKVLRSVSSAGLSLLSQVLMWYGASGFLQGMCKGGPAAGCPDVWQQLFYTSFGMVVYFCCELFVSKSTAGNDSKAASSSDNSRTLTLFARCLFAVQGGIIHNSGMWTLLDSHLHAGWAFCSTNGVAKVDAPLSCNGRNWLFVCVGILMLIGSHTIAMQAGVQWVSSVNLAPTSSLTHAGPRIEHTNRHLKVVSAFAHTTTATAVLAAAKLRAHHKITRTEPYNRQPLLLQSHVQQ